jgi:glycosyltransferase involved in cell wall biosynthesis
VSDIAECAEVVEDKAVTFKKGNVSDLKEKLQMLCENPDKVEKYQREAKDYVCNKYDWDAVVDKTLQLYYRK